MSVAVVRRRHGPGGVDSWRRAIVLVVVLSLLVLGVVANATMKRHRLAATSGQGAAVAFVRPNATTQSSAWYCPGPLPLGEKKVHSSLAIANTATASIGGQLVVSTSIGVSFTESISVAPRSNEVIALPRTGHSSFGAASVLVNGSGVGVEELTDGPTGRQAAACVSRAASEQYLAGGSTLGASDIALALFDPGATPSVADVSFATSGGPVTPLAYQGLPISAGQVLVLDVAHAVAQREVVATIVHSSGGHLVVGAVERAAVGNVVYPSLVTGNSNPETSWYLPALPAGGSASNLIYVLNPGASTATTNVALTGSAGEGQVGLSIPPGNVARVTPSPSALLGALRAAVVTSHSPVLVLESSLLRRPLVLPVAKTGATSTVHHSAAKAPAALRLHGTTSTLEGTTAVAPSALPAGLTGLPDRLPTGYAVAAATVSADGWVLPGGQLSTSDGEYASLTNPGPSPARVTLETLGGGEANVVPNFSSVALGPGQSMAVDLSKLLPSSPALTLLASSTSPVVLAAGLYARGSKGSVGSSEPVAIPLD